MGACRLSGGGLHLGHLNGCFLPRAAPTSPTSYVFVVADSAVASQHRTEPAVLCELLQDIYACEPYVDSLSVVFESEARIALAPLVGVLQEWVTTAQIDRVHPGLARQLATTGQRPSVAIEIYLFPMYQAAYLLGLGTRYVYMNDDNRPFVDLARRLAGRLERDAGVRLPTPRLASGPAARVFGPDYRRMAKGNHNCLRVAASHGEVRRYMRKLVRARNSPRLPKSTLPDSFLPFVYLDVLFREARDGVDITSRYRGGEIDDSDLVDALVDGFERCRAPFNAGRILSDAEAVVGRARADSDSVCERIRGRLAELGLH